MEEIPNWSIFLWALHELGGSDDFVDIENVFLRCHELAPQRFSWRTCDLPDYKKCAKALQEAEARRPKLLVKTGDSFGRQLSVQGQKWLDANTERLRVMLRQGRVVQEPKRRPRSRMLAEAEQASAFTDWSVNRAVPTEKWLMAELLRCSPDSDTAVWRTRLDTLRAAAHAADRNELLEFLDTVKNVRVEWFGGENGDET